jgi:hypothetical protein
MDPVAQDNEAEPTGARLTLAFEKTIPELTATDVKALLAPLISFDVKTPIQAFTDTLPEKLKEAILGHRVLVGMSTQMVLFAKGQPVRKVREMDGQTPFEEWIYGRPPQDVEFVRINGNRVIRLEVAKMGETPVIFSKDEVEGLMRTDGTPLEPPRSNEHLTQLGGVQRDPRTQAPAAPPSLRKPGETLPADDPRNAPINGEMRPVRFPKPGSGSDAGNGSTGQTSGESTAEPGSGSTSSPGSDPKNPPTSASGPPADGSPAPRQGSGAPGSPAGPPAKLPGANPDEETGAPASPH